MDKSTIIISLALFTLLSGLAIAIYQLWSADQAQKKGEHVDGSKSRPGA